MEKPSKIVDKKDEFVDPCSEFLGLGHGVCNVGDKEPRAELIICHLWWMVRV
jgi:hypothetical protein